MVFIPLDWSFMALNSILIGGQLSTGDLMNEDGTDGCLCLWANICTFTVGKLFTFYCRVEKGTNGCPLVLAYYYLIHRGYVVAFEQGTENRIDTNISSICLIYPL